MKQFAPPKGKTGCARLKVAEHFRNLVELGLKGEEMRATKLQELEDMAARLLATARKLPPGPDRSNILQEIGRFRSQIISLQGVGLRPARRGLRAKGK